MEWKPLKIIVAGDRSSSMMQLVVLLQRLGYEVTSAKSGAEALDLMERVPTNLVILDGHLSAQDGFTALEQIKNDHRWSNIPVIMMAAKHSKTSHDEYIRFGYEGLLTIPFDLNQMNILVQEYLSIDQSRCRKKLRVPFPRPVTLIYGGQANEYPAVNLSEGGIYLQTNHPLPVATEVEIILPLPRRKPLSVTGVVIYHKGSCAEVFNVAPGMAIEFQQLSVISSAALSLFITDMLLVDLPRGKDSIVLCEGQAEGGGKT